MPRTAERILKIPGRTDVYLRRTSATDAQELFDLINPPEQREHLRFQTWVAKAETLEDIRKNVKNRVAATNRGREMQYRIIEDGPDADQARMVGTVTLYAHNPIKHSVHLGYWLEKDSTGKGYAFDAAHQIVAYAQEEWSVRQLDLGIHPENKPSERLAAKLGAEPTGLIYMPDGSGELLWRATYV